MAEESHQIPPTSPQRHAIITLILEEKKHETLNMNNITLAHGGTKICSQFFLLHPPTTHLPYYLPGPSPDQTKIKFIIQTGDQISFVFRKK